DRIVSDEPPSREAVTISCTCLECELVKIFVNSGIRTAASVPQLMIIANSHHRLGSATGDCPWGVTEMSPMSSQLIKNEVVMHNPEAIQMRSVRGDSKLKSFRPRYFFSDHHWLRKYEMPDMQSIRNRMAKIQTISLACKSR